MTDDTPLDDSIDDLDQQTDDQIERQATSRPDWLASVANGDENGEQSDPAEVDDISQDRRDGSDAGRRTGEFLGGFVLWLLLLPVRFIGGILFGISRVIPKRTDVYRKMIKMGYKGLYKKTSAHVVCNTIYGDSELVPRVSKIDSETGNLETKNGEEWTVETGLDPTFIGDVPVVTGFADHHELVDHVGARIAEAVDYSNRRWQTVEESDQGVRPVEAASGARATNGSGAVADGGETLLNRSMTFSDIWVDASNPDPSNDGWIVSMRKAYALHWDQAGSEEMENQETRGILAARDPNQDKKRMIIIILSVIGAFALGLFGPALASQIAGGAAGGAGGGGIGLTLSGWLL